MVDATEIITSIIVTRGLETKRVAPLFQEAGRQTTDKIRRIGRAEGMMKMREEMRKVKNLRIKSNTRDIRGSDFEDMNIQHMKRRDCTRRQERGFTKI